MVIVALIVAIVSAVGTVGAFVVSQLSIKHVRKQADLALCQIHALRTPEWGEVEMAEGEGTSWTVALPLVSDIPLDSVRLEVLAHADRTAGLHLQSSDEGAPGGLGLGGKATWRLCVEPQGYPARTVRITSTAGSGKWSKLVSYPPKLALSRLVMSLKTISSMRVRAQGWPEITCALWREHFWSPSYAVVSAGGAPLDIVKQYAENQQTPNRPKGRPRRNANRA